MGWSDRNIFGPGGRLSTEGMAASAGGGMGRDEKAARKRAREAERAFRAAKGYPPDTLWNRLKEKFKT